MDYLFQLRLNPKYNWNKPQDVSRSLAFMFFLNGPPSICWVRKYFKIEIRALCSKTHFHEFSQTRFAYFKIQHEKYVCFFEKSNEELKKSEKCNCLHSSYTVPFFQLVFSTTSCSVMPSSSRDCFYIFCMKKSLHM